jgi:hypothetical protein
MLSCGSRAAGPRRARGRAPLWLRPQAALGKSKGIFVRERTLPPQAKTLAWRTRHGPRRGAGCRPRAGKAGKGKWRARGVVYSSRPSSRSPWSVEPVFRFPRRLVLRAGHAARVQVLQRQCPAAARLGDASTFHNQIRILDLGFQAVLQKVEDQGSARCSPGRGPARSFMRPPPWGHLSTSTPGGARGPG